MDPLSGEPSPAACRWRGCAVLVTGANGFVGRTVTRQATAAGAQVHGLSRSGGSEVQSHRADLCDASAVGEILREIAPAAVVHLAGAGVAAPGDRGELVRSNVLGTETLLAACAGLPLPPTVAVVGSGFEYAPQPRPLSEGDPIIPSVNAYGASKAAATVLAATYGAAMPVVVLRPFNIYGPGEAGARLGPAIVAAALAGRPVPLTAGTQIKDFLHIEDFGRALWLALAASAESGGLRLWNVGSGEPVAVRRYCELLSGALERLGLSPDLQFGALPTRAGEPAYYAPDIGRIRRDLGFAPAIPLEAGLDHFAQALVEDARRNSA